MRDKLWRDLITDKSTKATFCNGNIQTHRSKCAIRCRVIFAPFSVFIAHFYHSIFDINMFIFGTICTTYNDNSNNTKFKDWNGSTKWLFDSFNIYSYLGILNQSAEGAGGLGIRKVFFC